MIQVLWHVHWYIYAPDKNHSSNNQNITSKCNLHSYWYIRLDNESNRDAVFGISRVFAYNLVQNVQKCAMVLIKNLQNDRPVSFTDSVCPSWGWEPWWQQRQPLVAGRQRNSSQSPRDAGNRRTEKSQPIYRSRSHKSMTSLWRSSTFSLVLESESV